MNFTAITLIPKRINADKITEFRPISCCNVLYKVISKILVRRLETVLPDMIKGLLLIENVLLASELVQRFNQRNISRKRSAESGIKRSTLG